MKLTKFEHSCVRLEKNGKVLVIDPGVFSDAAAALSGADAVLITHEHPDHVDAAAVSAALKSNPDLVVYATPAAAATLRSTVARAAASLPSAPDSANRVHDAGDGLEVELAGFAVRGFGSQHALIHPRVPLVANTGFLIDGVLFHPGDSFTVPNGLEVDSLLVPVHAPWSKVSEVIDYVIAVRPRMAYNIHDGLLNDTGLGMVEGHLSNHGAAYGTTYEHLAAGDERDIASA